MVARRTPLLWHTLTPVPEARLQKLGKDNGGVHTLRTGPECMPEDPTIATGLEGQIQPNPTRTGNVHTLGTGPEGRADKPNNRER